MRSTFYLAALAAVLLGDTAMTNPCIAGETTASRGAVKSAWTVRGNLKPGDFVIQSHRGAGELAPENTIEAFELGWKLGTWPEADVRMTSDGVIVAFHDNNFARVVKGASPELQKKGVADVTFEELSKLDVGAWKGDSFTCRRVSRITEVFALLKKSPERRLYLDIKKVDFEQLAAEIRGCGVEEQVVFASTKYDEIRAWKKLVPKSLTLHWMGGTEAELKKRLEDLRAANFEGITQLQLHVHLNPGSADGEPFNLSRAFLVSVGDELRQRGITYQALPWKAGTPEVYWQLMDLGVAAFATDHPDVTVKAVRDYYSRND